MTVIVTLILLATTACGLELNHRRQPYPRPSLNGSTDIHDRDAERVRAELLAAADWAGLQPLGMPVANDQATSNQGSQRHDHQKMKCTLNRSGPDGGSIP